jgi:hypothetical protein
MANKTVKVQVKARRRKAFIDGTPVTLDANGKGSRQVATSTYHYFQYYIEGDPKDDFSAALTEPSSVARADAGKFDSSGKDAGGWWFNVEDGGDDD